MDDVQLATIKNAPIAKVGHAKLWRGGEHDFTEDELRDAVAASKDEDVLPPRFMLAHEREYDTGEPSFGTFQNMRYDAEKKTLFGDLTGTPLWLAKVLPSAYPNRSPVAQTNVQTKTGRYSLVIKGVGCLGVKMPAIKGMADLKHWFTSEMPDGVLLAAEGTPDPEWADTAIEREKSPKGSTVNIREKLGLPEDATDEQVAAKLDELAAQAAAGSPEALEKVKTDALAEAAAEAEAKAKAAEGSTVTVEAAAFDTLKADAQAGREAREQQIRSRRETLVGGKINKGAIAPASRDNVLVLLEAGAMTEDQVEKLPEGVLPIDSQTLGEDDREDMQGAEGAQDADAWMRDMPGLLSASERALITPKGNN